MPRTKNQGIIRRSTVVRGPKSIRLPPPTEPKGATRRRAREPSKRAIAQANAKMLEGLTTHLLEQPDCDVRHGDTTVDAVIRLLNRREMEILCLRILNNHRGDELLAAHQATALYERQGRFVKDAFERLAQRYVGVKLDTQQFSFEQGAQHLANERAGIEAGLNRIANEVRREFAGAQAMSAIGADAANGCEQEPEIAEVE